jgi:hypothetical protein
VRRTKAGIPQFPVQILIPEETRDALRQRSAETGASIRHIILRSLAADGFSRAQGQRQARHGRLSGINRRFWAANYAKPLDNPRSLARFPMPLDRWCRAGVKYTPVILRVVYWPRLWIVDSKQ